VDKLNAIREPHEGLSDVILRVAEETTAGAVKSFARSAKPSRVFVKQGESRVWRRREGRCGGRYARCKCFAKSATLAL
jgi:hypothetical protein